MLGNLRSAHFILIATSLMAFYLTWAERNNEFNIALKELNQLIRPFELNNETPQKLAFFHKKYRDDSLTDQQLLVLEKTTSFAPYSAKPIKKMTIADLLQIYKQNKEIAQSILIDKELLKYINQMECIINTATLSPEKCVEQAISLNKITNAGYFYFKDKKIINIKNSDLSIPELTNEDIYVGININPSKNTRVFVSLGKVKTLDNTQAAKVIGWSAQNVSCAIELFGARSCINTPQAINRLEVILKDKLDTPVYEAQHYLLGLHNSTTTQLPLGIHIKNSELQRYLCFLIVISYLYFIVTLDNYYSSLCRSGLNKSETNWTCFSYMTSNRAWKYLTLLFLPAFAILHSSEKLREFFRDSNISYWNAITAEIITFTALSIFTTLLAYRAISIINHIRIELECLSTNDTNSEFVTINPIRYYSKFRFKIQK